MAHIDHKTSRKQEKAKDDQLNSGVRISIDGEPYEVRLGDITPQLARELRRNLGTGFNGLVSMLASDPDLDVVAAFVWLARRCRGDRVDFDDVVVTYRQIMSGMEVETVGTESDEELDRPEA